LLCHTTNRQGTACLASGDSCGGRRGSTGTQGGAACKTVAE
jgi:hypothetical protein